MSVSVFPVSTDEKQLVNSCSAIRKKTLTEISSGNAGPCKLCSHSQLGAEITVGLNADNDKVLGRHPNPFTVQQVSFFSFPGVSFP